MPSIAFSFKCTECLADPSVLLPDSVWLKVWKRSNSLMSVHAHTYTHMCCFSYLYQEHPVTGGFKTVSLKWGLYGVPSQYFCLHQRFFKFSEQQWHNLPLKCWWHNCQELPLLACSHFKFIQLYSCLVVQSFSLHLYLSKMMILLFYLTLIDSTEFLVSGGINWQSEPRKYLVQLRIYQLTSIQVLNKVVWV